MTGARTADKALNTLLACAAEWTGFHPESVAREALRRALGQELASEQAIATLLRRAAEREPELVRVVCGAVGVRETYFFRHPEHFELVGTQVQRLAASGVIRAWSAACSSGEEAWSLAATIAATCGFPADPTRLLIVGTDIHEPALDQARSGSYRLNAQRPSGPILHPTFKAQGQRLVIDDNLRAITSFAVHDLRDPPPGEFELIFCRNVLIYFTREVARAIIANLTTALVPGGLLVFGTMDVDASDVPGLMRVGKPELMAFTTRPTERARTRPVSLQVPSKPTEATTSQVPPRALELHRSALMWVEIGGRASAEKALAELTRAFPDYVPGLLERALAHARRGDHDGASTWMTAVMKRLDTKPDDEQVLGLETLPVAFYREAARTYLERAGKS